LTGNNILKEPTALISLKLEASGSSKYWHLFAFNQWYKLENRVLFVRRCFVFWLFGQNKNTANSINPEHIGQVGARLSNILDYQTVPTRGCC
jgi:hypothetical protein